MAGQGLVGPSAKDWRDPANAPTVASRRCVSVKSQGGRVGLGGAGTTDWTMRRAAVWGNTGIGASGHCIVQQRNNAEYQIMSVHINMSSVDLSCAVI